ncbi:MAG: 4-hydroxy-tetrahydrodipicolinate reductase [Proteobacteria bacterium]|nr:4-hydroxy-tetrahydrodipicolinate reductase [Pseudomonadota bacterium]
MSAAVPLARVRAALIGAGGRMGQALLRCDESGIEFTAAVVSPGSALLGSAVPGTALAYRADLPAALLQCDVAIDFSHATATAETLRACRAQRRALLIGTTGFADALEAQFAAAAREIPLLVAANTSLGVALLTELVQLAAAALPAQFRMSIQESHHAGKRDAPSGTALALAHAAHRAADIESVREGDIVGEHVVRFAGPGEELTLAHKATDRSLFARGALAAALWLSSRPPGRYSMRDVLAMKTVT